MYYPKKRVHILTIMALSLLWTHSADASVLSDLASSMQPNSWAELPTNGLNANGTSILKSGVHSILAFNSEAIWDSAGQQLYILGSGHGDWASGELLKLLRYDVGTNAWETMPTPPQQMWTEVRHAYDHTTFNPETRTIYHVPAFGTRTMYKYEIETEEWTALPRISSPATCCGALEYLPELNSLFWYKSPKLFDLSTETWTPVSTPLQFESYSVFAEYNEASATVIFGGGVDGSNNLYKMDATKNIVQLNDSPFILSTTQSKETALSDRPGEFIFTNLNNNATNDMYLYTLDTDTWTPIPTTLPFPKNYQNWRNIVTSYLPEYQVMMYVQYNGGNSKAYLYKPPLSEIPEPSTIALCLAGMLVWIGRRQRTQRRF